MDASTQQQARILNARTLKVDPNIRPFLLVLERQLEQRRMPAAVDVIWRKRPDCVCRIEIANGEAIVPVSNVIREARARVDEAVIRQRLTNPQYLFHYENHVAKLAVESEVGLITIACAVFGPLTSSIRTSHQYNPYVEFWLPVSAIRDALGPGWLGELPETQQDLVQFREAAEAARRAGMLTGVDAATRTARDAARVKVIEEDEEDDESEVEDEAASGGATSEWDGARNEIYFGPPGTGKSHGIEQRLTQFGVTPDRLFRMTLHPEASYFDLVGAYRPRVAWVCDGQMLARRPNAGERGEPRTYYDFVPGPLSQALKVTARTQQWTALVLEEINRANCAAVFGDVFQLLDRRIVADKQFEIGWSSYSITPSMEWAEWLQENLPASSRIYERASNALRLPPKLLLLASMNTSDQNLFPLDAAFRRRWSMRYIGINPKTAPAFKVLLTNHHAADVEWSKFFSVVNARIVNYTRSDDKQMGPWFVVPRVGDIVGEDVFKSKVLYYLWNDVFSDRPHEIFRTEIRTYDELISFYSRGDDVFNAAVLEALGPLRARSERAPAESG
jgi:hypothetical protein